MRLQGLRIGALLVVLLVAAVPDLASAAPTISFKGGGHDRFRFHGRVQLVPPMLGGSIDPVVEGFGFQLSNAYGVIYEGWLQPYDLEYVGKMRYRFRDETALEGPGSRNGIFYIFSRFRQYAGVWWYTVRIIVYSDLSLATEPRMTLKWFQVSEDRETVPSLTVDWVRLTNGWRLPLNRF